MLKTKNWWLGDLVKWWPNDDLDDLNDLNDLDDQDDLDSLNGLDVPDDQMTWWMLLRIRLTVWYISLCYDSVHSIDKTYNTLKVVLLLRPGPVSGNHTLPLETIFHPTYKVSPPSHPGFRLTKRRLGACACWSALVLTVRGRGRWTKCVENQKSQMRAAQTCERCLTRPWLQIHTLQSCMNFINLQRGHRH